MGGARGRLNAPSNVLAESKSPLRTLVIHETYEKFFGPEWKWSAIPIRELVISRPRAVPQGGAAWKWKRSLCQTTCSRKSQLISFASLS